MPCRPPIACRPSAAIRSTADQHGALCDPDELKIDGRRYSTNQRDFRRCGLGHRSTASGVEKRPHCRNRMRMSLEDCVDANVRSGVPAPSAAVGGHSLSAPKRSLVNADATYDCSTLAADLVPSGINAAPRPTLAPATDSTGSGRRRSDATVMPNKRTNIDQERYLLMK